jgi:hypothetical protein
MATEVEKNEYYIQLGALTTRLLRLEKIVSEIVNGHGGDTRDELKVRIEAIETSLKTHSEWIGNKKDKDAPWGGPTYRG